MKIEGKELIVHRIARLFEPGQVVNLGIGMPTMVAEHLPPGVEILLQAENGFLGVGEAPEAGFEDPDLINPGNQFVTINPGGCFFDSAASFALIRGGHLDATVLGTLEVDSNGNIANYIIPGKMVAGMGGAMDLCCGAAKVIIATLHCNKRGEPKIVENCTLPLTAKGEADLIVTDLAMIEKTPEGLVLRETAPGVSVDTVISKTGASLIVPEDVREMDL